MSNIIKIKNSGTASATPSYLEYGELALNYNDEKIFYKNSLNEIVEFDLSGTGTGGSITMEGTVFASTLGNGVDSQFVVNHNLGTRDVAVSVREQVSPYSSLLVAWEATTEDSITLYFDSPPDLNSVRATVYVAVAGVVQPSLEGTVLNTTIGNDVDDQFVISHNFNSRDVTVSIREANSPYGLIITQWEATTEDSITVYFESPPTLNSVRVSIYIAVAGLEVGPQGETGPEGPQGPPGSIDSAVLDDLSNVTAPSPSNGDFLKWNGTAWVNDSIDLATDTVGSYVSSLVAGTGITLTNNSGEGATPNISIGQPVGVTDFVAFGAVTTESVDTPTNLSIYTETSGTPGSGILLVYGSVDLTGSLRFTVGSYKTTLSSNQSTDRTITIPDANGTIALNEVTFNAQTASYTLALSDSGKMVEMNVGSANNLTVPPDGSVNFPIGTQINVLQTNTGQTTIVAGSGVTVNATPGLKLRARWSSVLLVKRASNTWVALGDLQA
jgi:hypothetical protein